MWRKLTAVLGLGALGLGFVYSKAPEPLSLRRNTPYSIGAVVDEAGRRFGHFSVMDRISELVEAQMPGQVPTFLVTPGDRIGTQFATEPAEGTPFDLAEHLGHSIFWHTLERAREVEVRVPVEIDLAPPRTVWETLKQGWGELWRKEKTAYELWFERPRHVIKASENSFRHDFSPLEDYLDYEYSLRQDFDKERVRHFADNVSNTVALRLVRGANARSLDDALRLYRTGLKNKGKLMKVVAGVLRDAGVVYGEEQSLARAFDPAIHVGGNFSHLDCDLLVYTFMHVAYRLGLPLEMEKTPDHAYLRWDDKVHKFAIEATEFRSQEPIKGRNGVIVGYRKDGKGLGENFFPDANHYQKEWSVEKGFHAVYFQPLTGKQLKGIIRANVVAGLTAEERKHRDKNLLAHLQGEMERLAAVYPEELLFTNLYTLYSRNAEDALEAGQNREALEGMRTAIAFADAHDDLVMTRFPAREHGLLAQAFYKEGWHSKARVEAQTVLDILVGKGYNTAQRALKSGYWDEDLARAHFYLGTKDIERDRPLSANAYNQHLIYTVHFLLNNVPADSDLLEALTLSGRLFGRRDVLSAHRLEVRYEELKNRLPPKTSTGKD